jgi:hypothetical protein
MTTKQACRKDVGRPRARKDGKRATHPLQSQNANLSIRAEAGELALPEHHYCSRRVIP